MKFALLKRIECSHLCFFLIFALWATVFIPLAADTSLNIPGYRLIWHDEFERSSVDASKWQVNEGANAWYVRASDGRGVEPHWVGDEYSPWVNAGSINDERQYYTANNVATDAGALVIKIDEEIVNNPVGYYAPGYHRYTSGKLNTADEFQFQYGIVRIRADLPEGKGLWPALWMLDDPGRPWYWDDEIDIMEARGSEPTITTSAHHFKVNGYNDFNNASYDVGVNYQAGFHEYGLEWDRNSIRTTVDGSQVFFDTQAVPQDPMFLVMNAAVGGQFDGAPDNSTTFPTFFKIDWVRVWQPATTPGDLSNGGFEAHEGAQWPDWNTKDDGNLTIETHAALDGSSSVRIDQLNGAISFLPERANLFTNGLGGSWSGWLNERDQSGGQVTGYSISPITIPATLGVDSLTIGIHQTAPSPRANAVAYRSFAGADVMGLNVSLEMNVEIKEPFPDGSSALAFIRVFDRGFGFVDHAVDIREGGEFILDASIPSAGVPFIQVGVETTGATGSTGRLEATEIGFYDNDAVLIENETNRTGFAQTVQVSAGQTLRYGVLAANHPIDPIQTGSQGVLRLELLNQAGVVIEVRETLIVEAGHSNEAQPYVETQVTPVGTAQAILSIERVSTDLEADDGGSLIADVAFIGVEGATDLPVLAQEPARFLTVNEGAPVSLNVSGVSNSPLKYRWYRNGQLIAITEDLSFTATPERAGQYYLVLENDAGVAIGAVTEVVVLNPDSDGDLLTDYLEANVHGTNPNLGDSDGDGMSDYEEAIIFETDPLDSRSFLAVKELKVISQNQVHIDFYSVPGVRYQFQASSDLELWRKLGSVFTASENESSVPLAIPDADPPLRFFRIGSGK